jgi:hypothetical protein
MPREFGTRRPSALRISCGPRETNNAPVGRYSLNGYLNCGKMLISIVSPSVLGMAIVYADTGVDV